MSGKGQMVQTKVAVSGQAVVTGLGLELGRLGLARLGVQHRKDGEAGACQLLRTQVKGEGPLAPGWSLSS